MKSTRHIYPVCVINWYHFCKGIRIFILFALLLFTVNLSGQDNKVKELVYQGTELHDQGRFKEAVEKYLEALQVDKNSPLAHYELSYTYMVMGRYDDALKECKAVLKQKKGNEEGAYIVMGTSLDLKGEPEKAIKVYRKGLKKFPDSNLLNYNIALTLYNQKEYDKAEEAAIKAIEARPQHASSHIILSAIMQAKGSRIQSILPIYYSLMLEPDSRRAANNYSQLRKMLDKGVSREGENKINVTVDIKASKNNEFGPAEMMLSLLSASKYDESNKTQNDTEQFTDLTKSLFSFLGEYKKGHQGFWWNFYVTKLYNLEETNNLEAFCYYISQSGNSAVVNSWIDNNRDRIQQLKDWMKTQ